MNPTHVNNSDVDNADQLSLNGSEAAMNGGNPAADKEAQEEIARAETRCVLFLRVLTFGFLMAATITVAVAVKHLMRQAERSQLDDTFQDNAEKVLDAVGTILRNTFSSVDEFGVSMTSYANAIEMASNSSSWPFVTIPDFAVRASKLKSMTKIFLFSVYHYITHEERARWEAYSAENKGWIDTSIETQRTDKTFRGNLIEDWSSSDQINFYGQPAADAEFYIARWQASPVLVCLVTHRYPYSSQVLLLPGYRLDGIRTVGMPTKSP